jgi:hypothetical protein
MKEYNVNLFEISNSILDGKDDSKKWEKAEVLTDFESPWDTNSPNKIEFRAIWDYRNIYFYFKVFDNEIHIDRTDNSNRSIGNSDRVELFFRINDTLNPYYCLEIDPYSRIMDFKAYPNKKFDFNWNFPKSDLEIKSQINDQYFTVEIAINIEALRKLNLIKGNKIETGIFRAKYNKENSNYIPTWISWVNPKTNSPNFHISSSFGVLNLLNKYKSL